MTGRARLRDALLKWAQRLDSEPPSEPSDEVAQADSALDAESIARLASVDDRCGLILIRQTGEIVWFNQPIHHWLGLSEDSDIGERVTHFIRTPQFIRCVREQRFGKLCILDRVSKDKYFAAMVLPYTDDCEIIIVRDVTEQQRLRLAGQEMAGNLSHELRSPLTVIKGYLDTLRSMEFQGDDAELSKALDNMIGQTDRMTQMVSDMLTLSRLELDEVDVSKRQGVHLEAIITEAIVDTDKLYPNRNVEVINCDLYIHCVPNELYMVVANLLRNALMYSDNDSVVKIECVINDNKDRAGILLNVIDQGVGIPAAVIPRLTERFYRVDKSRTTATGGTGLGLPIVEQTLRRYKGKLEIRSEEGRGSTFSCLFPLSCLVDNPSRNDQ